jgi:glyoxylase-like metal-dependent hydrolase (beta-lactamase superfamily II)
VTLDVVSVVPGVHMLRFFVGQAYLCEEADRVSLIDAGVSGAGDDIFAALTVLGRRPEDLRQIIITHYHEDHTGALAWLTERSGARVLAHRLDAPVIRGEEPSGEPHITAEERPYFDAKPDLPAAEPAKVDQELEDGDELDVFGQSLVVGVPGHTPGSVAVYVPGKRLLFTGDAAASLEGRPIVGVFNVDPAGAREAFAKMAFLSFDVACFGHGDPIISQGSQTFQRTADGLAEISP